MSKPSESTLRLRAGVLAGVLATGALLLTAPAGAALRIADARLPRAVGAELDPGAGVAGGELVYQLRCWQNGLLLFQENLARLPANASDGLRLSGTDRNHRPIYLAETRNATCLIRSVVPERSWPGGN
jgi:hypothetical protein